MVLFVLFYPIPFPVGLSEFVLWFVSHGSILTFSFFQNPESRTSLPGIAFGDFARRFREPALDEGFEDIIPVKFQFQGTEDEKKVWGQYWI